MTPPLRRSSLALLPALLLAAAPAQASPEATFTVEGSDPSRGAFTGQAVLDVEPDRVRVALTLSFRGQDPVVRTGLLKRVGLWAQGPVCVSRDGLVQRVEQPQGADEGGDEQLRLFFDRFGKEVVGMLDGGDQAPAAFRGQRQGLRPQGDRYESLPGATKQELLWAATAAVPYHRLPEVGDAGVGKSLRDTLAAFSLKGLRKTFDQGSDERPPRTKIFHPYGAVAKVVYEPVAGHGFTGLFAHQTPGLARLSLAVDEQTYIPGIGLKLFVDGQPSLNAHAIPSFEGQSSRDFFARAPSTVIPEPTSLPIKLFTRLASRIADPLRRSVDALAAVTPTGARVPSPRAPYQLVFQPAGVHFAADTREDFRAELAGVAPGTVIYTVCAKDPATGALTPVGRVRTQSPLAASAHADQVLHFLHAK